MKNRALVGGLATALVVALVIAGLFAVGSPATARKARIDQERRNRISQLHFVLSSHVREEGSLPRTLERINDEVLRSQGYSADVRKDPETDDFFDYRRLSGREYEICATFLLSSEDRQGGGFAPFPGDVEHAAGRNCFEREITDDDVGAVPPFREGPSGAIRPRPSDESPSPSPESVESSPSPVEGV